jgi:hypothetical protein
MRCRFRLARAPQQQFTGRASGRLILCRSSETLGFFRHPFFKGQFVLDAATSLHDTVLPIGISRSIKTMVWLTVCPFPDIQAGVRGFN